MRLVFGGSVEVILDISFKTDCNRAPKYVFMKSIRFLNLSSSKETLEVDLKVGFGGFSLEFNIEPELIVEFWRIIR